MRRWRLFEGPAHVHKIGVGFCNKRHVSQARADCLRDRKGSGFGKCFFRNNWPERRIQFNRIPDDHGVSINMFVLEDANSIQVALMQVMRFILSRNIDARSGGLLVFALQTASLNRRHADLELFARESIVIDRDTIREGPPSKNAWEAEAFEDDEEDEGALDPDEEESLDDDDDEDDEEEDENEDLDDDDEDDDDSNEPEDEEEDGPPLYVEPDSVSSTVSTLAELPHNFDMSEELGTAER